MHGRHKFVEHHINTGGLSRVLLVRCDKVKVSYENCCEGLRSLVVLMLLVCF